MSNETLFYVFGIALAISAVVTSFIGLKMKDFPGKAFPVVVLWFAILVGGATTFAVLHAKDEQSEKSAEFKQAGKEIEKEQRPPRAVRRRGKKAAKRKPAPAEARQGPRRHRCSSPPARPTWPSTRRN